MAMKFKFMVDGGKATAGPPIGSTLGPLGVDVKEAVKLINDRTKEFEGLEVPVILTIDPSSGKMECSVGTPSTTSLLKREASVEKLSDAKLSFEQICKVARAKQEELNCWSKKSAIKQICGTLVAAGASIDEKKAKKVLQEIDEGKYDEKINEN